MANSLPGAVHDLLSEVSDLLDQARPADVIEVPPPDAYVLAIYWRLRSLFAGVRLLVEHHLPEEALILARSLFTGSLWLMKLAKAGDDRRRIILGWRNEAIEREKGLMQEAAKLGGPGGPARVGKAPAARRPRSSTRPRAGTQTGRGVGRPGRTLRASKSRRLVDSVSLNRAIPSPLDNSLGGVALRSGSRGRKPRPHRTRRTTRCGTRSAA